MQLSADHPAPDASPVMRCSYYTSHGRCEAPAEYEGVCDTSYGFACAEHKCRCSTCRPIGTAAAVAAMGEGLRAVGLAMGLA